MAIKKPAKARSNVNRSKILKLPGWKSRKSIIGIVVLFAVVAGGVFIYRSRAASTIRTLTSGDGIWCYSGCTEITEPQKNNAKVMSFKEHGLAKGEASIGWLQSSRYYRTCILAKNSTSTNSFISFKDITASPTGYIGNTYRVVNANTGYQAYCSTWNLSKGAYYFNRFTQIFNESGGQTEVSMYYVEKY